MPRAYLFLALVIPQLVQACPCNVSPSVRQAVPGTVDKITSRALDCWSPSTYRRGLQSPERLELRKSKTIAAFQRLKNRLLELLFDLGDKGTAKFRRERRFSFLIK
jgi:hypothetical protein